MSRSVKKNNIGSITISGNRGEKNDKKAWHKAFRRNANSRLNKGQETIDDIRIFSDPWDFAKDGKGRINPKNHTLDYAFHLGLICGLNIHKAIEWYNNDLNYANKLRRK